MTATQLTEHFTLEEFLYSDTAAACGIDNTPSEAIVANLTRLAEVLEEVRRILLDHPIHHHLGLSLSGAQRRLRRRRDSAHMSGLAADFTCPEYGTPYDVCIAIEPYFDVLEIDQFIWEYGDWIHLGLTEGQARYQCLTIDETGTHEGFH